jgi:DNA-binding CsgD family transcriptional regulator
VAEPIVFSEKTLETAQRKLIKHRNRPDYRRINVYYKSPEQYWKERDRRKKTLELMKQGFTFWQIAKQLGVSRKTIYRDSQKVERYVKGQVNSKLLRYEQEKIKKCQQEVAELSIAERFKLITKLMVMGQRESKQRHYENHNFNILINLDDLTEAGLPSIVPENLQAHSTLTLPWTLILVAIKNGERHVLRCWTISKATTETGVS